MNNKKNKKIKKSFKSLKYKSIKKSVKNKYSNGIKVKNGVKTEINGWKCITIKGAPYSRGYAHGHLLKKELEEIRAMLKYSLYKISISSSYGTVLLVWITCTRPCRKCWKLETIKRSMKNTKSCWIFIWKG